MPFLIMFLAAMLAGCTPANESPGQMRTNAVLDSDRSMYYQQNVLLPLAWNQTPHRTEHRQIPEQPENTTAAFEKTPYPITRGSNKTTRRQIT